MKKFLFGLGLISILNGCGDIEDYFTKEKSKDALKDLCKRTSNLVVCNENAEPNSSNGLSMKELIEVTIDDFGHGLYEYQSESSEYYKYMTPDEDGVMRGDCEDVVITFIQKEVMAGNIDKGEVKWVMGETLGETHAWAIVKKDGEEYVFDTVSWWGVPLQEAYEKSNYKELRTVFSY